MYMFLRIRMVIERFVEHHNFEEGSTYPISVAHAVDVVFQFIQFGGEVRQAGQSRAQVQRAPPVAGNSIQYVHCWASRHS